MVFQLQRSNNSYIKITSKIANKKPIKTNYIISKFNLTKHDKNMHL